MSDALDTQTSAILGERPPEKIAPSDARGYSLVLLRAGPDEDRAAEAVARLRAGGDPAALRERPYAIQQGLPLEDAMAGQMWLACGDCAAAFVSDEVASEADPVYLAQL